MVSARHAVREQQLVARQLQVQVGQAVDERGVRFVTVTHNRDGPADVLEQRTEDRRKLVPRRSIVNVRRHLQRPVYLRRIVAERIDRDVRNPEGRPAKIIAPQPTAAEIVVRHRERARNHIGDDARLDHQVCRVGEETFRRPPHQIGRTIRRQVEVVGVIDVHPVLRRRGIHPQLGEHGVERVVVGTANRAVHRVGKTSHEIVIGAPRGEQLQHVVVPLRRRTQVLSARPAGGRIVLLRRRVVRKRTAQHQRPVPQPVNGHRLSGKIVRRKRHVHGLQKVVAAVIPVNQQVLGVGEGNAQRLDGGRLIGKRCPYPRVQLVQKRRQVQFPTRVSLVAQKAIVAHAQSLGLVVDVIQIQRLARRQDDIGNAPHKPVRRPMRHIGVFEHPNPFRVPHVERIAAVGLVHPVAIEIQEEPEIRCRRGIGRHIHRSARQELERRQRCGRTPGRVHVGRDHQPVIVHVRQRKHLRQHRRLRECQARIRRVLGIRLALAHQHRTAFTPRHTQKGHRQKRYQRKHDERHHQRHPALLPRDRPHGRAIGQRTVGRGVPTAPPPVRNVAPVTAAVCAPSRPTIAMSGRLHRNVV